ncbi:related to BSD2 - metal homeostasis protein [Ustilago sp. UG-2017b]|nr:related to BSD2 - metal homeostasis protein [Ustilago sp. UG-2017b]
MARPGEPFRSQSTSRRSDELFAAFNGPADTDPGLPGCNGASSSNRRSTDVFFDAGDALPALDSHHDNNTSATDSDPLGANRANAASSGSAPSTFRPPALFNRTGATPAYDFERPEYFPIVTRRPPSTSSRPDAANNGSVDANASSNGNSNSNSVHQTTIDMEGDDSMHSAGGGGSGVTRNGYSSLPTSFSGGEAAAGGSTHDENMSRSDRLRFALGRFGRFVGMGIPGARYSSLSQQDGSRAGVHRPRLVGGGIGQDGVFANLSAKPERRRRGQNTGTTDDRGDDDDLEDDAQPPTYEIAAADAVPQYWETTILGGSVHPLANGLGWVPGGAHVGAIEDLIVEGLAVGNLFGFAWNLLVSMTFQFVGFLLTYLLHTTHAARCGSRAGLGVTLIQYGFYLRTRASEMAGGKIVDTSGGFGSGGAISPGPGSGGWFGEDLADTEDEGGARRRRGWISRAQVQPDGGATLADLFAAQADGQPVNVEGSISDSMSQSTEWLAYVLMVLGWTILLSSMLSYWRIWRWAKSLVDAAHREQESSDPPQETSSGETAGATSIVNRFRSLFGSRGGNGAGSGEDWVLFPGIGHRLGRSGGGGGGRGSARDHPTSIADLEDDDGLDTEDATLNPAERRLLADMRRVGLA